MNAMRNRESKRKPSEFTRFVVADLQGNTWEVTPDNFATCEILSGKDQDTLVYSRLKQFVKNELTRKSDAGLIPKHIVYMKDHELLDYCEVSERGHFSWLPKGVLLQRLILDYAANLAYEWGAIEMKNPILIRGDHNLIGQLMGEFHERDYRVDGGRGTCYLRYASDPLAFPFMQRIRFYQRQSPLKVFEEVSCFRNEQEGEVSGLKRVRGFTMTDMHAACASQGEARREFENLCFRFAELMNDTTAKGRWVLGWEGTVDFYENNKDWLVSLGKQMEVPAFFKLMPEMSHYYAIKNEYQFINQDNSNVQVSTVQWDVKDGPRFGIGYIDEEGRKCPCPVIIHASSFGSIERALCAILENIAIDEQNGTPPKFPFWLSPTQIRIIPVADRYLPASLDLCDRISQQCLRVDIDDREATVGKKIRNGETEWVPFLLVVGEKEENSNRLSVRSRDYKRQEDMTIEEFIEIARQKQGNKPFRPLTLSRHLTKRPSFR
jgi:threonyl-tRNA synthetase